MNDFRNTITNLFESAENSIQVAVSWFTDDILICNLAEQAKYKEVEVLLSADPVNVFGYNSFNKLIQNGGRVKKIGPKSPFETEKGFMHKKIVITDKKHISGGSYNFTENARHNLESFRKYDISELNGELREFERDFAVGINFFSDINNPKEIIRELRLKFEEEEKWRINLVDKIEKMQFSSYNDIFASERSQLIKTEMQKQSIKEDLQKLESNEKKITATGVLGSTGTVTPKNRFYGGTLYGNYSTNTITKFSYAKILYQKYQIEKKYSFLRCRIENNTLICVGNIRLQNTDEYRLRIEFREGHIPQVFITSPKIELNTEIHIYKEGCLCLFYPGDIRWKDNTSIANHTIPWTIKWILNYELWKITGKWESDEIKH